MKKYTLSKLVTSGEKNKTNIAINCYVEYDNGKAYSFRDNNSNGDLENFVDFFVSDPDNYISEGDIIQTINQNQQSNISVPFSEKELEKFRKLMFERLAMDKRR